jgi:hypothetical protein
MPALAGFLPLRIFELKAGAFPSALNPILSNLSRNLLTVLVQKLQTPDCFTE